MNTPVASQDSRAEAEVPEQEPVLGPAYLSLFLEKSDETLTLDDRYLKSVCNDLEKDGFLERVGSDFHQVAYRITDAGKVAAGRWLKDILSARLSEEEKRLLLSVGRVQDAFLVLKEHETKAIAQRLKSRGLLRYVRNGVAAGDTAYLTARGRIVREAISPMAPTTDGHETQASISSWCVETFGEAGSDLGVLTRANEEMAEMLQEFERGDQACAAVEAADVAIIMMRYAKRIGEKLPDHALLPPDHDNCAPKDLMIWANHALAGLIGTYASEYADDDMIATRRQILHRLYRSLDRFCVLLGTTLQAEIDAKMQVNRMRRWALDGTGHGYHVDPGLD